MKIKDDPVIVQCEICFELHRPHQECPSCNPEQFKEPKMWKRPKTRGEWS